MNIFYNMFSVSKLSEQPNVISEHLRVNRVKSFLLKLWIESKDAFDVFEEKLLETGLRICDKNEYWFMVTICQDHIFSRDKSFIQEINGFIFHNRPPFDIICANHVLTEEITEDRMMMIFKNCDVYRSFDGTLLRLFHYGGEWKVCTSRRMDADNAFWGMSFRTSKPDRQSFRTLFDKVLKDCQPENNPDDVHLDKLDRNKIYFVSIRHPDAYHTLKCIDPSIKLVAYMDRMDPHLLVHYNDNYKIVDDDNHTIKQIIQDDLTRGCYDNSRGFILIDQNNPLLRYKYDVEQYQSLNKLKGNTQDPRIRWMELEFDDKEHGEDLQKEFKSLYPSRALNQFIHDYKELTKMILKLYKTLFVFKTRINVPDIQKETNISPKFILFLIHRIQDHYLTSKTSIKLKDVKTILFQYRNTVLKTIQKQHIENE